MRIFSRDTVLQFCHKYPDAEPPLRVWLNEAASASWRSPIDVKARFPHVSIIGGRRLVFNIGGNKYRLIVEVDYVNKHIFVHFIGTHRQYDKVNAETVVWNQKS